MINIGKDEQLILWFAVDEIKKTFKIFGILIIFLHLQSLSVEKNFLIVIDAEKVEQLNLWIAVDEIKKTFEILKKNQKDFVEIIFIYFIQKFN